MKIASCRSLILVLLFCLPSLSFSYEGDPVTNAIKDLGHVRRAPLCLKERSNQYLVGGLLGAGVLLYANDRQVLDIIQKNKSRTLVNISRTAEKTGNGAYELAFLGGVAGAGYIFKDDKLKDTAFMGMESFLAANAIGTVMKYSLGRARLFPFRPHDQRIFHSISLCRALRLALGGRPRLRRGFRRGAAALVLKQSLAQRRSCKRFPGDGHGAGRGPFLARLPGREKHRALVARFPAGLLRAYGFRQVLTACQEVIFRFSTG